MNPLTRRDLRELMEKQGKSCLSIYMPTHRTTSDSKQDSIRFKNLLREAQERLTTKGFPLVEMRRLLKPARSLLKDSLFCQYQGDGLAVVISTDFFRSYCLPVTLPELLVVTDRFHIKPILQLLTNDGRFYVLALSQNEVRLLQCTRYGWSEVDLKDVPRKLAEDLHRQAWEILEAYFLETQQVAAEQYGQFVGSERASKDLTRIVQAAHDGRIDLLFVPVGLPAMGNLIKLQIIAGKPASRRSPSPIQKGKGSQQELNHEDTKDHPDRRL